MNKDNKVPQHTKDALTHSIRTVRKICKDLESIMDNDLDIAEYIGIMLFGTGFIVSIEVQQVILSTIQSSFKDFEDKPNVWKMIKDDINKLIDEHIIHMDNAIIGSSIESVNESTQPSSTH